MKNTKEMMQEIPAIVEKKDFINWSLKFSIAQQWALKIMYTIYLSTGKYYNISVLDEDKLHLFTKTFQDLWEVDLKPKYLVLYMQYSPNYTGELEEIKQHEISTKINVVIEEQMKSW